MAEKTGKSSQSILIEIEELQKKHMLKLEVFCGMKVQNNWKTRKRITEKEFIEAKDKFLNGSIGGK